MYEKEEIYVVIGGIYIGIGKDHLMMKTSIEFILVCPIRDRCNWSDSGG
jgi:hypothetical protein